MHRYTREHEKEQEQVTEQSMQAGMDNQATSRTEPKPGFGGRLNGTRKGQTSRRRRNSQKDYTGPCRSRSLETVI